MRQSNLVGRLGKNSPFVRIIIIAIVTFSLSACGSQNPVVERQKGEIDYLTRENEQLHRIIALMEANGGERPSEAEVRVLSAPQIVEEVEASDVSDNSSEPIAQDSGSDDSSESKMDSTSISDESEDSSNSDQLSSEVLEDGNPSELEAQNEDDDESITKLVVGPATGDEEGELGVGRRGEDNSAVISEVDPAVYESTKARILAANKKKESEEKKEESDDEKTSEEDAGQDEDSASDPETSAVTDQGDEGVAENAEPDLDSMTPEEQEQYEWDNRPRQRPQPPLASLSTRQFFEDGTSNLTSSAKTYLKLVAGILSREHSTDRIEVESQDILDEPDLLADRLNTVLQELEKGAPGFMDRVVLLPTPTTYNYRREVEDPHHIKIYPIR